MPTAEKQSPIQLESEDKRIVLRQYTESDVEEGYALIKRNREHFSQFNATPATITEQVIFEGKVKESKEKEQLWFGIWKDERELIGEVKVSPTRYNPQTGVVGYALDEQHQGNGYMRSALKTIADFTFAHTGITELHANIHVDNSPSVAVARSVGFQLESIGRRYYAYKLRK